MVPEVHICTQPQASKKLIQLFYTHKLLFTTNLYKTRGPFIFCVVYSKFESFEQDDGSNCFGGLLEGFDSLVGGVGTILVSHLLFADVTLILVMQLRPSWMIQAKFSLGFSHRQGQDLKINLRECEIIPVANTFKKFIEITHRSFISFDKIKPSSAGETIQNFVCH